MGYRAEIQSNWRYLAAATLGMSLGYSCANYVMSLFGPEFIEEFGWSRAQYALVGSTSLVTMFFIPVAGRLTDVLGVRRPATIGFVCLPAAYVALSFMTGNFAAFLLLNACMGITGILTTSLVFTRVAVERFDKARGIALSLTMSGAPLTGALAALLVAAIIEHFGWRDALRALAAITAVGGASALMLLGPGSRGAQPKRRAPGLQGAEVLRLMRTPLFLCTTGGMFLVNLPQSIASTQLKLVLMESHAPNLLAASMISLYAAGVLIGRIVCGLALDRRPAHEVALLVLAMPAFSLIALASPVDTPWLMFLAILFLGLAQGAEGDIGAYIISRKFPNRNYSFMLSLLTVSMTLGISLGSLLLSYVLRVYDSYGPFLYFGATATLTGAGLFFLTGRCSAVCHHDDDLSELGASAAAPPIDIGPSGRITATLNRN